MPLVQERLPKAWGLCYERADCLKDVFINIDHVASFTARLFIARQPLKWDDMGFGSHHSSATYLYERLS